MSFIFIRKFSASKVILLLFIISSSLSGCKKGYDKYWSKENPKTGFIYDKVKNDPNFTIFAQGLERAGLVQFVNVSGLYTVFAPTNDAFQKFFKANGYTTIEDVPTADLFAILSYHIANNMWYYYDFRTRFTTAQKNIYITRNNKFLNVDASTATTFNVNGIAVSSTLRDLDAENGVIHGIAEVLIPLPNVEQVLSKDPELANTTFYKLMQVLSSKQYDRFNSYDANRDGKIDSVFYKVYPLLQNVNTSIEYVVNTAPESQGGDPVFTTVLIPSNAVLDAILAPVLPNFGNDIKNLPKLYIEALLESYFIKDRKILSAELIARPTELKAINEEVIPALTAAKFERKDIEASNGVIHILNTSFPASDREKSAIGMLTSNPIFTDFVEGIQATSLMTAYAATAKTATFLVPTNEAFANAGLDIKKKTLNGVTLTVAQLTNIIKQHVISSNLARTALTGSKTTDYASNPLVFTTTGSVITVKGTGANTAIVGEEYRGATGVTNGYVFKIDKVLIPATY
jgi:uncharacterized surface protein with fasciclin (FAS1) repeats